MNYINISKKRLVGRNNQQLSNQFIVDYSTVEDVSFQIINDQNQIQSITDQDGFYLAGSIGIGKQSYELLFLSKNYTISSGNTITFSVDTYTTPYLNSIKKKYTEINLEIGQETSSSKKVILRDFALACPRVYVDGVPPSGDLNKYYTKEEIEGILSSDYWTKYEVATAIADIETMDIEVVEELPPISSAQEYTIYLVPAEDSEIGNFYDEFLVINGAYEKVGSTAIDMSQYAMKSDLSGYMPISGDIITSFKLSKDASTPLFTFNNGSTLYGYPGLLFYSKYSNCTNLVTTAQTTLSNDTVAIGGLARIRLVTNNLLFNEHSQNTPGGIVTQDLSGNISASGFIEDGVKYNLSDFEHKQDQIISDQETITLSSNVYIKANDALSALTLTIPSGLTNSVIFFKTGDTFTSTINTPENAYVNEDFDFGPSGAYILSVEDDVILWSELTKRS